MVSLKLFICVVILTVLSIQSSTSGLVIRQLTDVKSNKTVDSDGLDNIEDYMSLIGGDEDAKFEDKSNGFEQTELILSPEIAKLYTLGQRLPGDTLVARAIKALNFPTPHNVRLILTYPTSGVGSLIDCVMIAVEQSNVSGQAYVLNGGLNQRHITIAVEAVGVTHFYLNAGIYGK